MKAKVMCMKKLVSLFLCIVMIVCFSTSVSAAYGFMDFRIGGSVFFLTGAESGGHRLLASNPFDLESIEVIYVESGSMCMYGGQDGYAMPPILIRVDYKSGTKEPMSNPVYRSTPLSEENYECTVDELFSYCGATSDTALILEANNNYYMLAINGASLPEAEERDTTAYEQQQTILVDDKPVQLNTYALKDKNGYLTNYIRVRDVAALVNGTEAQFEVSWDGAVNLVPDEAYTVNGIEFTVPFSGDRTFTYASAPTKIWGTPRIMSAIVLNDDNGGGYTYYKLRDLGEALGFDVSWSAEKGVYIETDQPYTAD